MRDVSERHGIVVRAGILLLGLFLGVGCAPVGRGDPPPTKIVKSILVGLWSDFYVDPLNAAALWQREHRSSGRLRSSVQYVAEHVSARKFKINSSASWREVFGYVRQAGRTERQPIVILDFGCDAAAVASGSGMMRAQSATTTAVFIIRFGSPQCAEQGAQWARAMVNIQGDMKAVATRGSAILQDWSEQDIDNLAAVRRNVKLSQVINADGIALNLGKYQLDGLEDPTVKELAKLIKDKAGSDKRVLVDSSVFVHGERAGQCNPATARVGPWARWGNPDSGIDALWLKAPGTSDGDCGAGAGSRRGEFVPRLAAQLLNR